MSTRQLTIVALTLAVALGAHAKPEPQHSEHASPAAISGDSELSEIVVLCAEEEKKFESQWRSYVDKHDLKGKKLDETIAWVGEEAIKHRKKAMPGKSDEEMEAWLIKRREFMSEAARRVLNPIK